MEFAFKVVVGEEKEAMTRRVSSMRMSLTILIQNTMSTLIGMNPIWIMRTSSPMKMSTVDSWSEEVNDEERKENEGRMSGSGKTVGGGQRRRKKGKRRKNVWIG